MSFIRFQLVIENNVNMFYNLCTNEKVSKRLEKYSRSESWHKSFLNV